MLTIGLTALAVLVVCAGIVLVLCARAPHGEEAATQLSQLDRMDGITARTPRLAHRHAPIPEPERVA